MEASIVPILRGARRRTSGAEAGTAPNQTRREPSRGENPTSSELLAETASQPRLAALRAGRGRVRWPAPESGTWIGLRSRRRATESGGNPSGRRAVAACDAWPAADSRSWCNTGAAQSNWVWSAALVAQRANSRPTGSRGCGPCAGFYYEFLKARLSLTCPVAVEWLPSFWEGCR